MSPSTKELADLQEKLASLIAIPTSKWFTIMYEDDYYSDGYTVRLQQLPNKFETWLLKNLKEEMTIDKTGYVLSTASLVDAIKKCSVWARFGIRENLQEFLTEAEQRMDKLHARYQEEQIKDVPTPDEEVAPTSKWCTITFDNIYQCYNVFPKISANFGEWLATHYRSKMAIQVDGFCYKSDMFFVSIENDNKWCSFVQLELLQEFLAAVELRLDELYARYQQELEEKAEKLPTSKWFTIKLDEYDVNDSYDVLPNVSTEFRVWLDKNIKEEMSIEIKHCILSSWCFVDAIKRKYVWCSFSDLEELQRFLAKAEPRLDELYARYQKELAPEPPTSEWFTIERDEDDCFAVMVKVSPEFGEWLLANYQDELDIDANGAVIESFNDAIRCKDYVYACFSNLEDLREFLAEVEPRMSKLYARYDAKSDTLSTSECKFIPTSKCCENKQQAGEEFCSEHANTLPTSECKFIPTSKCCENKQQAGEEFCSEHANTLPTSKWFDIELDGEYFVTPKVSAVFGEWLVARLDDDTFGKEFSMDISGYPWSGKGLVIALRYPITYWCKFGKLEFLQEFLAKAERRMNRLYTCYQKEQLPTSKWCTIEFRTAYKYYEVFPKISPEFGEWLATHYRSKMAIQVDCFCYKSDLFFNSIKYGNCWCRFAQLERVREFLAQAEPRMSKRYARYQIAQLPAYEWLSVKYQDGTFEVRPNIQDPAFKKWLSENHNDKLNVRKFFTIGDRGLRCSNYFPWILNCDTCWFWFVGDQENLAKGLVKINECIKELHARYSATNSGTELQEIAQLPDSKWFTFVISDHIKLNVSTEFGQWLVENLQSELDRLASTETIKICLKNHGCSFLVRDVEQLREELPKLNRQLDKLYARFQEEPPTSKWFTVEYSGYYHIKPNVSTEFSQWLVKNVSTELNVETPEWIMTPKPFLDFLQDPTKECYCFGGRGRNMRGFLVEADQQIDKLYARFQEEQQRVLTSSKWFNVARTNTTRAPDIPLYALATNTNTEFAEWLVDNITADEKWISGHQSLYYAFKHKTSFYLDYRELVEFLPKADQRVSELYTRYQMRGCREDTSALPTSKWFTVRGSGTSNVHDLAVSCYSIIPCVSDEFGSWLLACDDHGLIVNGCGADVSATMFRNCIEHGTWVGYDNLQVLTHDLAQLDQRMDELYERYQTDAPNVEPDLHEQAAEPLSRWFGMERRPFPFSYHIKLSVSNDFNEWLTRNCTDELDIDKPNWKILTAALTGKYSSGIILSEEIVHEFLAEADPRMSKLYERYHKELAAEPPTSKWFTIETKSCREFFSYRINLAVSGDFGKWLAKNLQDELDIDKPKWRTLTPLFLDIDAFTGTGYVSFSQLENVCEFLAEADQRMEKLYERYEEQAALPLSKWFTIQHNLCYDADLQVSAEFRHWLIANLTTELDMVLPLELPFQISTRKVVRCLTENGYALFGFYKLQVLREFLAKAELRMDALYARYLAELVAPPPTSKWFTVVNEFIYRVKLAVSDDFGKWLVKNLKNELDIEKSNWTTFTWSFVVRGYLSGYVGFSGLENVREFLAEADPRMVKLYERYQTDAQKCGPDSHENAAKPPTSTCSVQKCEPGLHENAAKPPTSKWFTFDKISFLYSVKPNVSAEFRQWLVANVEKIDMDINKLHWNISSGGFVRALNTTMTISWINLYYRDFCEFLAEVEPRMEKLYELYQNELPTSKWFTVYRGSISFGHPIVPTSVSPEFRQWLVKNHITELDIKAPQYTNAEISTVRGGFFWTALKIGGDEMNNFFAEVDKRMDKLYERFQAEQQEPWISIDRVEVVRVLVQAPRAFVNYCSGKTFAGVLLDWRVKGKRQIQSEPPVWRSNMANLGCGLKKGTGICCQPGTIPRLQAALVEAHQAWQPDPEPGRLIIGKPPVEFEVGAPEQGYKVSYHPGLGKPSEICDSLSLRKAIAETVQVVA